MPGDHRKNTAAREPSENAIVIDRAKEKGLSKETQRRYAPMSDHHARTE